MLFIVPDDSSNSNADGGHGNPGAAQSASGVAGGGAPAEDEEDVPRFKVELDLDDAPFMEDEKPTPEPEAPAAEPEAATTPSADAKNEKLPLPEAKAEKPSLKERLRRNKKKLALVGAALVLFIAVGIGASLFLSGPSEPAPAAPPTPAETAPPEVERRTLPDNLPLPPAPEAPKFIIALDSFVVPVRGPEDELRLLFCSFSVPTDDPLLQATLQARMVVVRDGIYFYLSKQTYELLSRPDRTQLKQDIISVINEQISNTEVKELLIADYNISAPKTN